MTTGSIALFVVLLIAVGVVAYYVGVLTTRVRLSGFEKAARKDAVKKSRAVLTGNLAEQLAPYLPGFRYKPTELRFVGKPVDYVVFEGLDERKIRRVIFLEIKSGEATLNEAERSLRDAVKQGRVDFEIYEASACTSPTNAPSLRQSSGLGSWFASRPKP
jgi:predicted Holliday junction resolvase-like endonuclease